MKKYILGTAAMLGVGALGVFYSADIKQGGNEIISYVSNETPAMKKLKENNKGLVSKEAKPVYELKPKTNDYRN